MIGQDEVRAVADHQPAFDDDPERLELLDLGEEGRGIDDHAVAEDADRLRVQDARRDQPQHELRARDVDGMAGVVPALVPGDRRKVWGEEVDELALALVAPLRA